MRKQAVIFTFLFFQCILGTAQVAINTTGNAPDSSAVLDLQSTTKGMLIPRMDSVQRESITTPATGLMVFDTDFNSFWFFNGTAWQDMATVNQNLSEVLTEGNSGGWQDMEDIGQLTTQKLVCDTNDTPRLRLYQNGNSWPQYTWDVAGNEVNFFIRDVNESSNLPFRIKTGSLPNRITIDGSNVGIGLNTNNGTMPTATESLDVGGRIRMREGAEDGFVPVSDANGAMTWTDPFSIGLADNLGNHIANQNLQLNGNYLSGDGDSEGIFVGANGNVGMGTASPGAKLEVAGNAHLNAADPILEFRDETGTNGVRKNEIKNNFSSSLGQDSPADQSMVFNIANNSSNGGTTSVMTLQGDGNVGIGTTSPTATLDVNGEVKIQGGNPSGNARLISTDDSGNAVWEHSSDRVVTGYHPAWQNFGPNAIPVIVQTGSFNVKVGDLISAQGRANMHFDGGSGYDRVWVQIRLVRVSNGTNASDFHGYAFFSPPEDADSHDNWMLVNSFETFVSECNCEVYIEMKWTCSPCDDHYFVNEAFVTGIRH